MLYFLQILIIFFLFFGFFTLQKRKYSLSTVIFTGLIVGVLYGLFVKSFFPALIDQVIDFIDVFRISYINLLRLIVIPLIFVSIFSAVIKLNNAKSLGLTSMSIVGILLLMTAVAAVVGIVMVQAWGLDMTGLIKGIKEEEQLVSLVARDENLQAQTFADLIVSFIPSNIFVDLSQARSSSTIAVVIFAALFAIAALRVIKENESYAKPIHVASETLTKIVYQMVKIILALTPYGIFAVIVRAVIQINATEILQLGSFVAASYVALFIIFLFHLLMVSFVGVNPIYYIKKASPAYLFAFSSRSSAATIPYTVEVQVDGLKNDRGISNFAASIGASVGQNACAGLYPAMLAVMAAPSVGIDPTDMDFLIKLVVIIVISSLGAAGVGGGATNAALIVFGTMGLPIEIVALLISVEAFIDMGRTAINVNGAITAGTVTSRLLVKKKGSDIEEELIIS